MPDSVDPEVQRRQVPAPHECLEHTTAHAESGELTTPDDAVLRRRERPELLPEASRVESDTYVGLDSTLDAI